MEARRVIIRGRVQGVGFRWFVVRNARALGVAGTVRNRPDGSVEAVLQAERTNDIQMLIGRLREGPPAATVEAVDIDVIEELEAEIKDMQVIR